MQRQAQRLQLRRPETSPVVPANCAAAAFLCLEKRCEVGLELQFSGEEGKAVRVVPRARARSRTRKSPQRLAHNPISGWCCPRRPFMPVKWRTCPSGAAETASDILRPNTIERAERATTSQSFGERAERQS
mmetsp:Transcript_64205/g.106177  ORF Transcript_64205/g.106177 Transcript_64205/m.106177 type:complete len:131 (+) Transcript_64205:2301-2693(+)